MKWTDPTYLTNEMLIELEEEKERKKRWYQCNEKSVSIMIIEANGSVN